jgi:hypothetical protein
MSRRKSDDHHRSSRRGTVNGYPALILRFNEEIDTVMAVRIGDGLITGLYAVAGEPPGAGWLICACPR